MSRILTILLVSLMGCMELPNLKNDDGPPANPIEITNAMNEAWAIRGPDGKLDPIQNSGAAINLNEMAYFSKSAQLAGGEAREFQVELFNVHKIETYQKNGSTYRDYRMLVSTLNINGDNNEKPLTSEFVYDYPVPNVMASSISNKVFGFDLAINSLLSGTKFNTLAEKKSEPPLSDSYQFLYANMACTPDASRNWSPQCYNLKVWNTVEPAPVFVRKRAGCEGLSNCQMNIRHVAFDLVTQTYDEEAGSKVRLKSLFHFQFSPDLPFLSRLVSFCTQGLGKYKDQPYVATVCNDVADFQRGTAP